ncbi:MAG: hypothetical protein JXR91_07100 [Deltaproteobacteria bacterium]|nr:hypothetical protein [Deltaproteobacteria bacterium]
MMHTIDIRKWLALSAVIFAFGAVSLFTGCGEVKDIPEKECQELGVEGCGCLSAGICNTNEDGVQLDCINDICAVPDCSVNDALDKGCLCGGDAACAEDLLCLNGNCVEDNGQTYQKPANPKCYTPCKGGYYSEKEERYIECSDEGLLEGCIGDGECIDGTCVVPSAVDSECGTDGCPAPEEVDDAMGKCENDDDCPIFQACIGFQCYSDCEINDDCRTGRECYKKTCRVPCSTEENTSVDDCPDATFCSTEDGVSGYCLPINKSGNNENKTDDGDTDNPKNDISNVVEKDFVYSADELSFTNNSTTASLTVTNNTQIDRTIKIKKIAHSEFKNGIETMIDTYPLSWVKMSLHQDPLTQVQELEVKVKADGGKAVINIGDVVNSTMLRWTGIIEIQSDGYPSKEINLNYTGSPEGSWTGKVYYFSNFGTRSLNDWANDRESRDKLKVVGNAFVRRWGAFRQKRISWDEFKAVLSATQNESWNWESVKSKCPDEESPNNNAACYLYDNGNGIALYSDYVPDNPIPTGVVDFTASMNLKAKDPQNAPGRWYGKVLSNKSLQYGGNPAVSLEFASDPNICSQSEGPCVTFIDDFNINMIVGGRYSAEADDTKCSKISDGTYTFGNIPWLIPGFAKYTTKDSSGRRYLHECRDTILPLGSESKYADLNWSLSAANPIPDGTARKRTISIIDGAMIDQEMMFIIFKESFPSFLSSADDADFESYGYMLLKHMPSNLSSEDYKGSVPVDNRVKAEIDSVQCTQDIIDQVGIDPFKSDGTITSADDLNRFSIALIEGQVISDTLPPPLDKNSSEKVHYYCEDTNLFDGGPLDDDLEDAEKVPCPAGSKVIYFTLEGDAALQVNVANNSCQVADCQGAADCGCIKTLNNWQTNGYANIRIDPIWKCEDSDAVFCSSDRSDLRQGKQFYPKDTAQAVFSSLDEEVEQAFRYKTKFKSKSGTNPGFAPEVCIEDSNSVPYCYDPPSIEEIEDRVDCASYVYTNYYKSLGVVNGRDARDVLKEYVQRNYSYGEEYIDGYDMPVIHDGFENLFAELLVMMGDEAYTSAFSSRFDLAMQNIASFEGSLFEPDGINLDGGAGFEMYRLYQAAQYYKLSLDRFYRLSPLIWKSISELPSGQGIVTSKTVVTWFERLVNASSKKTRVWSEISKRYHNFNRPELARIVIERAYTAAHLESMVLNRMMLKLVSIPNSSQAAQIEKQLQLAASRNRAALLDMKNAYDDISDDITYFGFKPDYIPFPALYPMDVNAFSKSMSRAMQRLDVAKEKETRALEDNRQFETSSELFQAELARISNEYEAQLGLLCGTFTVTGPDGETNVYPAISKYADLDDRAKMMGNPCGLMGNGDIYDSILNLEIANTNMQAIKLSQKNVLAEIDDANEQVQKQCERIQSLADFHFDSDTDKYNLQSSIQDLQLLVGAADRTMSTVSTIAGLSKCTVGTSNSCPAAAVSIGMFIAGAAAYSAVLGGLEDKINEKQLQIAAIDRDVVNRDILDQCDAAKIDVQFTVKSMFRKLAELQLETMKVLQGVQLGLSDVQKKRNEALRVTEDMNQTLELMVNTEAARNDPNVRVYRNDAVINADKTFFDAMQQAYRVTKIYEYYTSTSYADMIKLNLIRMVSYGTYNLERYLADLNEAFLQFEEDYGLPDTRVSMISLKDDILGIPYLDKNGVAYSSSKRNELMHKRLQDVTLLDDNGYIVMPFSTSLEEVSPLTTTHKVQYIQAEIIGSNVGDAMGRIYLRQKGTGVVRDLEGEKLFYSFPERTAVVDTFFNGLKFFDPDVYKNERLRDRPFVNTEWEIVFNQKDESVNKDIALDSLTDVRLYLYYSDFTGE